MLPLSLQIIPKIKIGTETFFSKREFHVSLLCIEDLLKFDQKRVFKFALKFPVKLREITKTYRLVTRGNRQSIIVRVHLRGLKKLILEVNKHFGYNFVYPPTHITLFTLKDQYGIAVDSTDAYHKLTRKISQIDYQNWLNPLN